MALQGHTPAGLGVADLRRTLGGGSGVAVFVVGPRADGHTVNEVISDLKVGIWPAGEPVGSESVELDPTGTDVAGLVVPVTEPRTRWVSFATPHADPTVVSVPVLPGRLATLVAQVQSNRIRLHQYHPDIGGGPSSTISRLRRVEYLQRLLVAGRVDIAERVATQIASVASEDPFAGVVAGYVLLRLGRQEQLDKLASAVIATASTLSDASILRAEHGGLERAAGGGRPGVRQHGQYRHPGVRGRADTPARGTAEERIHPPPRGTRPAISFNATRGARCGAAFTPRRGLQPGLPVISAVDLGFEA
jgi:hypothetical protein